MAEEKGKVVLFGTRWSGRATVAKMLVSGELEGCSLEPTDCSTECKAYAGRGWTVLDTMGFGEPLGGIVPDEYVTKMAVDFLNQVKGRYSHIIFVVDRADFPKYSKVTSPIISFMWKTFLETFKGGEENFVVLVTNETPAWRPWILRQNELDARVTKMFPECKHFLYTESNPDPEDSEDSEEVPNDGQTVSGIEALERFEKEMEKMFTATNCPWVEPEISTMGDAEIQETAATISRHLTSALAIGPREWGRRGSAYEPVSVYEPVLVHERISRKSAYGLVKFDEGVSSLEGVHTSSTIEALQGKARQVLRVQHKMQNLVKEVKFFPRQCDYLLQRSMEASKELHDLAGGTVEAIWDDDDTYHLAPLLKSLDRLKICTEAGEELLQLCGNSKKEGEVALTLSSRALPGTSDSQVSKFALVIRDLDWSLDAFRFLWHNPEAQRASSESERQSWLSKFLWCESRRRLVYVGDGEDKDVVQSSIVAADNDRQAEDQRDLVSAMESHFTTFQNPRKVVPSSSVLPVFLRKNITTKQLSSSKIVSYMSILRNRLQGDASFDGDSGTSTVPGCFRIPGKQEYKVVKSIGEGSYKKVHKCNWLGMNVAIATESQCNGQYDQGGEFPRTALEAEAGLLARVQHPNVVTFIGYGYDEENRRGFQVSELMESSLRALINRGYRSESFWSRTSTYPFSVSQSIDILLQIVEAMIHVHECGVIYRDLKADNCLANRKYYRVGYETGLVVAEVKLTDFGTSELQSPEMGCHFNTPNQGSRPWMAPELYQRPGEEVKLYTWSADVYSFGMTCYEVITGEVPFGKLYPRLVREAVCAGRRPPIPGNCPDELRELMTKCWAHIPKDRPTFKEIREILWRSKLCHTIWKTHSDPDGMFSELGIGTGKMFCGTRKRIPRSRCL